ncbi:MAG: transglycosylase domain-containing protein [Leptospiraceae bacterium]|nr:transglycosylase domain-containing protein [Leptospiraceae bacterium]
MKTGFQRIFAWLEKALLIGLFSGAVLGGLGFGFLVNRVDGRSELNLLSTYRPSTPTRLYDRNGQIFAELYRHKQDLVRFTEIPPEVVQAFLAIEDDNFYNHFGLDFLGIVRAAIKNVLAGRVVQGGSTLTQQLAKQIYLNAEGKRERSFGQKLRETILAVQMEEQLSKREILEVYFNVIYLGHGCKGIACASRLYFNKRVQDLSLAEGAVLSRLPKSPIEYSPYKYPDNSKAQHMVVLNRMAELGYLPASQVQSIHDEFWEAYWPKVIVTAPSRNIWSQRLNDAPYFTDYVRQILEANPEVGEERLYTEGLKVYTTLDLLHQRVAEEELFSMLAKVNKRSANYAKTGGRGGVDYGLFGIHSTLGMIFPVGSPISRGLSEKGQFRKAAEEELSGLQMLTLMTPANNEASAFDEFTQDTRTYVSNLTVEGAFIGIEPRTGAISTMIGGREFSPRNQFNRALQARRQPGSAFKIFVYGGAIENRTISSMSSINDAPFFTIAPDGSTWSPGNYEQGFYGMVPAKRALAMSLNTCSVQVFFRVGPEPIIDLASRLMKISNRNRFNPDPALALGASEITPFELATAVSIIANGGKDVIPYGVRYVSDQSGGVIFNSERRIRQTLATKTRNNTIQVIEPGLAYILRDMMKGVADGGTARHGIRTWDEGAFSGDVACKTGTTSGWSDAWITGFNPELAITIWFGFDKASISMGPGQAGGGIAAPVMGSFYRRIYQERKQPYPRFADLPDWNRPPPDVRQANCDGLAMADKKLEDGTVMASPVNTACGGDPIVDERKLLMERLGITAEDLGERGHIRFKKQE